MLSIKYGKSKSVYLLLSRLYLMKIKRKSAKNNEVFCYNKNVLFVNSKQSVYQYLCYLIDFLNCVLTKYVGNCDLGRK